MDELDLLQKLIGGRAVGTQSFRSKVGDLPSDHPPRIDRLSNHPRRSELGSRVEIRDRFGQPGEGLGQQRIAHQDCDRISINDMNGFPSATEVIVVDGGKVVKSLLA